jgi:hypothetical protein
MKGASAVRVVVQWAVRMPQWNECCARRADCVGKSLFVMMSRWVFDPASFHVHS